jgi:quercetin dioxygenase-like cupin family protein
MPQYFKVRLDNARVRVLEFRLKPGEKEIMHSHSEGIVFVLSGATTKSTFPDGSTTIRTSKEGDVTWRDPLTHMGENIGSTEAHYFAVELKNCPK